ncbi:hypothetical protein EBS80_02810 [bacterium]|nr:hypothetical protein [bacterium]
MTQTHAAQSFDEQIVAFAEVQEKCVSTSAGEIPPPAACPAYVHSLAAVAEWHIATAMIVIVFVAMMFELTMIAFNPGGGH